MAEPTESAVIIPIGSAEPIVAEHRRDLDVAASWGVPAHVTVVYPFVPPRELDDQVVSRLRDIMWKVRPFQCAFSGCAWFGDDVLWLAPDPDQPFRDLTAALTNEFPDYPPYGGAFGDDPVPHLTVGERERGTAAQLRAAEAAVAPKLPVHARIEHAVLIAGTREPNSWRTVVTLPFGAGSA